MKNALAIRWQSLSTRDRRMLVILALAFALFAVIRWGVFPWLGEESGESEVGGDPIAAEVARMAGWLEANPRLEQDTARLQKLAQTLPSKLLPAGNPALAAAAFQNTIKRLADQVGVRLNYVQIGSPESPKGRFGRVALALETVGSINRIFEFLHAIEAAERPAIGIENLELRKPQLGLNDNYILRLDLFALYEIPNPSAPKAPGSAGAAP